MEGNYTKHFNDDNNVYPTGLNELIFIRCLEQCLAILMPRKNTLNRNMNDLVL